jgi:hypothetical protein
MKRILLICVAALFFGCANKLDTGYVPRKLNANATERRAYYAPAFSPESQAVKTDREDEIAARRRPGY